MSGEVLPFYVEGAPCEAGCRWCHPMVGLRRPEWAQLPAAELERALATQRPARVAIFGAGVLDLPAESQQALRDVLVKTEGAQLTLSVRPDQVLERELSVWREAHLTRVELVTPTIPAASRRWMGASHRMEQVGAAAERVRSLGLGLTLHLIPGLPGWGPAEELARVEEALRLPIDRLRLTPAVVVEGTALWEAWRRRDYSPMTVQGAVELGRRMLDLATERGIDVIRYGYQPPDLRVAPDDIVAGPFHPSLRLLVESARMFDLASRLFQLRVLPGGEATLRVNPAEESWLRGLENHNLARLRHRFRCRAVHVEVDPGVPRGELALITRQDGWRLSRLDLTARSMSHPG